MLKNLLRAALAAALALSALPAAAQNRLINMVPNNRSAETNQDAEPTITVDPNDFARMVGVAFTWDNLTGAANSTNTAPIYVSSDRGQTWTLSFNVPSLAGQGFPTGDINVSFGATLSGAPAHTTSWLYGGILQSTASGRPMTTLRAQDPFAPTLMTTLSSRTGNVDQPHVAARTSFWDVQDKFYVGFNNGWGCVNPNGRTATLDMTQDAKVAAPAMALNLIESRDTPCQDGFATVPAAHLDGTVYVAYIHDWSGSPRMVVARDDNWGQGAAPFTALTDPSDAAAGRFVAPAMTLASGFMGQNRLGASNVSMAVDPRDSSRVYVAWGDGGSNTETIHVRRSIDRGQNWSAADLLNVTNAMNPQVAINTNGTVGVLYQRLVAGRWETRLVNTTDADATVFNTPGLLLANQSATTPTATYNPYIGDYASLVAAGKSFVGMFSASNFPDTANFMAGVQFQREVNWATHQLFTDATHTTTVAPSIDPFFFEVNTLPAQDDFYVRDWTDDGTHADNGVEPSTNTNFYSTSDVWNQRVALPLPFVNDQPPNEDAGNGAGSIGDNWAFARVRRKAAGPASSVTAHFLVSRFGTGGNYVDATTGDPNVIFPGPDPVITTDGTAGPWTSAPYLWRLAATAGNHLCLAVEISSASDPFVAPSLVNNTPGWSTGTDLRVVSDNNKAQRNMHLSTMPATAGVVGGAAGTVTDWALVHNAGLVRRDILLRVSIHGLSRRYVRDVTVFSPGERQTLVRGAQHGTAFLLRDMEPGENRWVAVTPHFEGLPMYREAYVNVDELGPDGKPSSGFAVGLRSNSTGGSVLDGLWAGRVVLRRLESGFAGEKAGDFGDEYERADLSPEGFTSFVRERLLPRIEAGMEKAGVTRGGDPFNLKGALDAVYREKTAETLAAPLATFLNALDARLTQMQLSNGDPADILQMVRWQRELFRQQPKLSRLGCASELLASSNEFLRGRESRKLRNDPAYPELLAKNSRCLLEGLRASGGKAPNARPFASRDLSALQKEHRSLLLELAR
ncbi:MAG TPA: hypothetical protein VF588_01955 [Pyrinomonadaceae bacterium]|jgi:hypothetical protein